MQGFAGLDGLAADKMVKEGGHSHRTAATFKTFLRRKLKFNLLIKPSKLKCESHCEIIIKPWPTGNLDKTHIEHSFLALLEKSLSQTCKIFIISSSYIVGF